MLDWIYFEHSRTNLPVHVDFEAVDSDVKINSSNISINLFKVEWSFSFILKSAVSKSTRHTKEGFDFPRVMKVFMPFMYTKLDKFRIFIE